MCGHLLKHLSGFLFKLYHLPSILLRLLLTLLRPDCSRLTLLILLFLLLLVPLLFVLFGVLLLFLLIVFGMILDVVVIVVRGRCRIERVPYAHD